MSNGSKREQIYKCGWLWQTGYYAKTKRKGERGMREGWEYKKLGEVGTFLRGKSIQKADFVEHGLPCIHYGQIHNKFGVSVDKHLSEIPEEVYNKSIIASPGDVVIAITSEDLDGSCKSTAWLGDYDVAVSSHAAVYKHNLNPKFIAYYLRSNSFYVEKGKYARGFKVMEIKPTDIARIPIPLPSEEIQSRVVAELDKINELIRLKREQLKDYDNLAQSIFYEMFGDPVVNEKGWKVKKIGEIGTVERGAGISKKDFVEDGLPCIHYGQLHTILGPTTRHHHSCIPESLLPKYKIAHTNDVIMAITSEDVEGSCKSTAWLGNYDIVIGSDAAILHHEQDGTFLSYYTMTKAFFNEKSKYAKGFKVTHISAKEIENIPVYLPPLALQKDFAKRIEVIEHQKENIKSTIQDLETLLASRMQYWFD